MLKDTIELINKDLSEQGELNKSNTWALIDLMAAVNTLGLKEPKASKSTPATPEA